MGGSAYRAAWLAGFFGGLFVPGLAGDGAWFILQAMTPVEPSANPPTRQTTALRQGRQSLAGAVYFVTFCTAHRQPWLTSSEARRAGAAVCDELVASGDARMLAATLMPDHVHLLFALGGRLSLARLVAKWKARVRPALGGGAWQANYFEHRLRPEEAEEPYAWYIFMNPYRSGLVTVEEVWSGWWPLPESAWTFLALARSGPRPQPEWLDRYDATVRGLVIGA